MIYLYNVYKYIYKYLYNIYMILLNIFLQSGARRDCVAKIYI